MFIAKLDCYIAGEFFPTARALFGYFQVAWNLYRGNCFSPKSLSWQHCKSMTLEGNSALFPATRDFTQWRRELSLDDSVRFEITSRVCPIVKVFMCKSHRVPVHDFSSPVLESTCRRESTWVVLLRKYFSSLHLPLHRPLTSAHSS